MKSKKSSYPKTKKPPASYRQRSYRQVIDPAALVSTLVTVRETDLHVLAPVAVEAEVYQLVYKYRNQLETYMMAHPEFLAALHPLPIDPLAPPLVRAMQQGAAVAGVGPMAAVAGAIAEFVGRELLAAGHAEVMVENGGDIFMHRRKECVAAIFAGQSPLNQRVGVRIRPVQMPLGICTSSGTVGHSLSLGEADSVTVLAASTPLADSVATRLGNEVLPGSGVEGINRALTLARGIAGLMGVVIIQGEQLGAWGDIDLVKL